MFLSREIQRLCLTHLRTRNSQRGRPRGRGTAMSRDFGDPTTTDRISQVYLKSVAASIRNRIALASAAAGLHFKPYILLLYLDRAAGHRIERAVCLA